MMAISSTAPISAFSPGLAKKAARICLESTVAISAHSTRNTSIRTRKIRGDDSLVSSISIVEREVGTVAMCASSAGGRSKSGGQYGTAERQKKIGWPGIAGATRNFRLKPRLITSVSAKHLFDETFTGSPMTILYLQALLAIALSLAILMAIAWTVQQRTGNSGWVDTIWTFSLGIVGAGAALWPVAGQSPNARQWLVAALVAVWSVRLGSHIAVRTAGITDDPRYAAFAKDWGADSPRKMFIFLQNQGFG